MNGVLRLIMPSWNSESLLLMLLSLYVILFSM